MFHPGVSPGLSFLLPDTSWFQPDHQDHLASEVDGNDGSEDEELSAYIYMIYMRKMHEKRPNLTLFLDITIFGPIFSLHI